MNTDFSTVHNHYERPVFEAVQAAASRYPGVPADQWPDVACVALNRVGVRYIRHPVDLCFYLTEKERAQMENAIEDAVSFAFEFVQARRALQGRG